MIRPLLLDLFCGAGGAAMGYYRAGFEVVGVDIKPQPHYPFEFVQADAFDFMDRYYSSKFAAVHASPPCQAYSTTRVLHGREYPMLVEQVRSRLRGRLYVIENVPGAPLLRQQTFDESVGCAMLCGSSFGLGVRRHRNFEASVPLRWRACLHHLQSLPIDVTGTGGPGGRHRKPVSVAHARLVMGIEWEMTRYEISQAIPPAYTEFIGRQLLDYLKRAA